MQARFDRVVCAGVSLSPGVRRFLESVSRQAPRFEAALPDTPVEWQALVGDADCLVTSIHARIGAGVAAVCPGLRYIGVYGSHPRHIDLGALGERGVTVRTVRGYCDVDTAEFVLIALGALFRDLLGDRWGSEPRSLEECAIGIVGLGAVGSELARLALAHRMRVAYFSRTRRPQFERAGCRFASLEVLLAENDVVSLHGPPGVGVLGEGEFRRLKRGTVLINTCVGEVVEPAALGDWLGDAENLVVMDESAGKWYPQIVGARNALVLPVAAYRTARSIAALERKFEQNIRGFLGV